MKKNWINGRDVPIHVLKKMFLIMKLTFLLTVLLNVSVWATGFSQENRVSLQMKDVSLEKIIPVSYTQLMISEFLLLSI